MNALEFEINKAGYVRGSGPFEWYAGGPGVPEFPPQFKVQVRDDRIRVYTQEFFGTPYTSRSWWDQRTVAIYLTVEEFLAACPGKSSGGVSHAFNSFD